MIDSPMLAESMTLTQLAQNYGIERLAGESDDSFRSRIKHTIGTQDKTFTIEEEPTFLDELKDL